MVSLGLSHILLTARVVLGMVFTLPSSEGILELDYWIYMLWKTQNSCLRYVSVSMFLLYLLIVTFKERMKMRKQGALGTLYVCYALVLLVSHHLSVFSLFGSEKLKTQIMNMMRYRGPYLGEESRSGHSREFLGVSILSL